MTSSRDRWRRASGITPGSAASRARSARVSFGRRGCRRRRTASWRRRIKISAVCHVSARRDSLSHPATRVASRNTNRRHMTGDHHGRSLSRATLPVRAVDAIPGTHNMSSDHHGRTARIATRLVRALDEILGTHRVGITEFGWDGTIRRRALDTCASPTPTAGNTSSAGSSPYRPRIGRRRTGRSTSSTPVIAPS